MVSFRGLIGGILLPPPPELYHALPIRHLFHLVVEVNVGARRATECKHPGAKWNVVDIRTQGRTSAQYRAQVCLFVRAIYVGGLDVVRLRGFVSVRLEKIA